MAEDIVRLLSLPVSPIILVFDPEPRYPTPRGTPSTEHKMHGDVNFFAFLD